MIVSEERMTFVPDFVTHVSSILESFEAGKTKLFISGADVFKLANLITVNHLNSARIVVNVYLYKPYAK